MPGIVARPACAMGSKVRRPTRIVSNCETSAPKSMAGSITIQSASPFDLAMYPSRLIATEYRTRRTRLSYPN